MADYRFGYWECTHEYPGDTVSIRPAPDFEQARSLADQRAQRGKEYVMPTILEKDGDGRVPADRFELPVTHVLSIPGRPQDRQLGEFMVLVLGFLHGLRFTIEGDGHLFRTPHREGTLVNFRPAYGKRTHVGPLPEYGEIRFRAEHAEAIRCMETALATWDELDDPKRKLLFAAIHWYLVGQSYPHQFEQFNWQHSVLDNLYNLEFGRNGWSRISIRCMPSGNPARHSSGVRRARAGGWSRPPMPTAASPAAPWNVRDCSASWPTSP